MIWWFPFDFLVYGLFNLKSNVRENKTLFLQFYLFLFQISDVGERKKIKEF